jgi:hypothetical protein
VVPDAVNQLFCIIVARGFSGSFSTLERRRYPVDRVQPALFKDGNTLIAMYFRKYPYALWI